MSYVARTMLLFRQLKEAKEREEFLDKVEEEFCLHCGQRRRDERTLKEGEPDHDCPYGSPEEMLDEGQAMVAALLVALKPMLEKIDAKPASPDQSSHVSIDEKNEVLQIMTDLEEWLTDAEGEGDDEDDEDDAPDSEPVKKA